MVTVKDAIQFAARYLAQHELRFPQQDAELLVASVLQRDRSFLYAHPEAHLSAEQGHTYRQWLERRGDHYPLQYLRGQQEFYGRELLVRPGVFIPRPETELLVETGLELLRQWSQPTLFAADVGTGAGCIAVSLACEEPRVLVTATDTSQAALEVARINATHHNCMDRIEFCEGDTLGPLGQRRRHYHLITSNPPYVSTKTTTPVDASVSRYEPKQAVFAGNTGHEIYLRLFREALSLLRPGGYLLVELGYGALAEVAEAATTHGWLLCDARRDLAGIERCAVFEPEEATDEKCGRV